MVKPTVTLGCTAFTSGISALSFALVANPVVVDFFISSARAA